VRVLVVDDNADIVDSLAMLLELEGYEVAKAGDGLQAVAAAGHFRPHLVLLDIGMPRLDGYGACRRIREQPWGKRMRIVALTGWGQDDIRRKCDEAGFDRHLVKPVEPAALRGLLAELGPVLHGDSESA
jgi:CheY-like chemotaxis protein